MTEKIKQGIMDKDKMEEAYGPMYKCMADDISKQQQRLGGNWAIAQAVFSRNQRDFLRKALGPDLVFIVLNMSTESQLSRVKKRHGDSLGDSIIDMLANYSKLCEPAGSDEKNAFNVTITDGMTPVDVVQEIITIVKKL